MVGRLRQHSSSLTKFRRVHLYELAPKSLYEWTRLTLSLLALLLLGIQGFSNGQGSLVNFRLSEQGATKIIDVGVWNNCGRVACSPTNFAQPVTPLQASLADQLVFRWTLLLSFVSTFLAVLLALRAIYHCKRLKEFREAHVIPHDEAFGSTSKLTVIVAGGVLLWQCVAIAYMRWRLSDEWDVQPGPMLYTLAASTGFAVAWTFCVAWHKRKLRRGSTAAAERVAGEKYAKDGY